MKKSIPLILLYAVMVASNAHRSVPKMTLKSDQVTIEYGSDVSINPEEYVTIENPQYMTSIGFKSALISDKANYSINEAEETVVSKSSQYLDVGTYDSYIVYAKEQMPVRIEVVDTIPPVFKNFKTTVTIPVNSKKEDLEKFFSATDLSDVKITIDDEKVEYDKVGEYKIKVTAMDAHRNKTEKKCTVKIVSEEEFNKIGLVSVTEKEDRKEHARISDDDSYYTMPISVPETGVITSQPVPGNATQVLPDHAVPENVKEESSVDQILEPISSEEIENVTSEDSISSDFTDQEVTSESVEDVSIQPEESENQKIIEESIEKQ